MFGLNARGVRRGPLAVIFALSVSAANAPVARAAQVFDLDPARSSITFTIGLFGVSHRSGRFSDVIGAISRAGGRPQDDVVMVEVRTASVQCGSPGCDKLVSGPRFFDAARFPTVRFQSRKITRTGDVAEVAGDLTLHGVTRPIMLTAQLQSPEGPASIDHPIVFAASATVRRSDFDMSSYRLAVGDTVTLSIRATFVFRTQK